VLFRSRLLKQMRKNPVVVVDPLSEDDVPKRSLPKKEEPKKEEPKKP